jgi:hypothetical protein
MWARRGICEVGAGDRGGEGGREETCFVSSTVGLMVRADKVGNLCFG